MKMNRSIATCLIFFLIITESVFAFPTHTQASLPVIEVGPLLNEGIISAIKDTITSIETTTTAAATVALEIDRYVLEPLAFVMSGNLLQAMTGSIIAFVDGSTNGTGQPQFVQNLQGNTQNVGDIQALAFFAQLGRNSNSPFSGAITSSLQSNYLQQTSLGGFFAANQCTLSQSSPNINGFLAGDWSQGGAAAWLSLQQPQNNPYTQYQRSQAELGILVSDAVTTRLQQLNWGQGFLSWCQANSSAASANNLTDNSYVNPSNGDVVNNSTGTVTNTGTGGPSDPCIDSDGNPGTIQTPGSVIRSTLNDALGSPFQKLASLGSVGPEINTIMSNIGTVLSSVNFATELLGGSNSGGLFGVSQPYGGRSPLITQYASSPSYLGVSPSTVYQGAASLSISGSTMLSQVSQYLSAWNTIGNAANAASSTVQSMINYCVAQGGGVQGQNSATSYSQNANASQISQGQTALTNEIAPVLSQYAAAQQTAAAATAMANQVQAELQSGAASSNGGAYTADVQTLQTMSPTANDVANAAQQAQAFNQAGANPAGSLNVSGGSLLDQMNLISSDAQSLQNSCTPPSSDNGGGGAP